jgi:aminoglycoside phosphotransferase (APT) family kinase protein
MESEVVQPGEIVRSWSDASRDLTPVLVLEPLEQFLDSHQIGSGPIEADRIGDGHSFETFSLRRGDVEVVLRRPPPPPITPGVHDVLREARVLRGLQSSCARVPRLLATCTDTTLIGVPFTIMERVEGDVVATTMPPSIDVPAERRRVSEELIDALVELHAVRYESHGLGDLGRPNGFLSRRLDRYLAAWARNSVRNVPDIIRGARILAETLPTPMHAPTIVHGDYRLGNVMYALDSPARLLAILDWETATIGDPLTDLGFLLATYPEPGEPDDVMVGLHSAARRDGFCRREELAARYTQLSGRATDDLAWYMAFGLWRVAIQLEGLYRRSVLGLSRDPFHQSLKQGVPRLAQRAIDLVQADTRL